MRLADLFPACTHPVVLLHPRGRRCVKCREILPPPATTVDQRPCGCGTDPAVFGHTHAT